MRPAVETKPYGNGTNVYFDDWKSVGIGQRALGRSPARRDHSVFGWNCRAAGSSRRITRNDSTAPVFRLNIGIRSTAGFFSIISRQIDRYITVRGPCCQKVTSLFRFPSLFPPISQVHKIDGEILGAAPPRATDRIHKTDGKLHTAPKPRIFSSAQRTIRLSPALVKMVMKQN